MKKAFLYTLLVLLILNFGVKAIEICVYDKAQGKVIDYDTFVRQTLRRGRTYSEYIKSPLVEFRIENRIYHVSTEAWGFINVLKPGDTVTVLYNEDKAIFEINSFFTYWLTFYNLVVGFSICFIVPICYEIIRYNFLQ